MTAFSSNPEIQMVSFFLDGEEYGINVMQVREIISMAEITKTANAPQHVEGIINLRGKIIPIISLRKRLGMLELPDESMSFIAIMDFGGELTGFIIDEISDVRRIRRSDIQPPPDTIGQAWNQGILDEGAKLVVVMDLEALV